ncbi:MAG: wax ester/triacylglycerol synthase family O-acyltransferase [Solirubrobacteraceae bacterium]
MDGQEHLDRLSAIDAGFLAQEKPNTHMHIGALALFEGEPPELDAFLAHIESRLHLVPRYRQKLATPPLETGRPLWIDDPTFNLAYHVRHTALPPPGEEEALLNLCARIFSQRLDRSKPLWELWLVEGLDERSGDDASGRGRGGFALISKTHHAVVDGVSGVDLSTVLFDLSPEVKPAEAREPWVPQPEPTGAELAARGLSGAVRAAADVATGALGAVSHPPASARGLVTASLGALERAREVAAGVGEVAWTALNHPPDTPFNVPPGPHRRIKVVRAGLDEFKTVKDAFGTTVNDVVLAVVTGALAFFLQSRGRRTEGVELKAAIPVSVRTEEQQGALGNQLTQLMAPLPVFLDDPLARLRYVKDAMDGLKESRQLLAASAIASLQDFAPPTLHAQASRLNFSGRFFNLLVTNVPGPQFPLYVLGRRMSEIFPIPFLAGERALAIAIISYDGKVGFGLLGDYDALPDLDVVAEGIEASLAQLVALAQTP